MSTCQKIMTTCQIMMNIMIIMPDTKLTSRWQLVTLTEYINKIFSYELWWYFFWQVDIMIWQVEIKIWQVDIIIWQVMAEICHHTFKMHHTYLLDNTIATHSRNLLPPPSQILHTPQTYIGACSSSFELPSLTWTRGPQALRSPEYQRLYTDFLSEGCIFAYQQPHYNNN